MKMIKIILVLVVIVIVIGIVRAQKKNATDTAGQIQTGQQHFTMMNQGIQRDYYVYIPSSYDPKQKTPVLFEFHGGGGRAEHSYKQSLLDQFGEQHNIIIVWPDSTGNVLKKNKNWNVGGRFQEEKEPGVDDVVFIEAVFAEIKQKFNIDEDKVFATGLSNGGMITYHMACFSTIFKGIAPIGTATITDTCPSKPIPVIHMHGTLDKFIPIAGGPADASLGDIGPQDDFRSFEENRDLWISHNRGSSAGTVYYQKGGATCMLYPGEAPTVFCRIENHGHTWPGGAYPVDWEWYKDKTGPISNDLNANELMWQFFLENSR